MLCRYNFVSEYARLWVHIKAVASVCHNRCVINGEEGERATNQVEEFWLILAAITEFVLKRNASEI